MLMLPHPISFSLISSVTILLACGDLPVLAPEKAIKAPVFEIAFLGTVGSDGVKLTPYS